jgi:hypothetical protein
VEGFWRHKESRILSRSLTGSNSRSICVEWISKAFWGVDMVGKTTATIFILFIISKAWEAWR